MARKTKISEYPFVSGEHAEIDSKILPDGYLTRAKNVRLRKDGRFGVRGDFDALGNDTANAADIIPYDLMGHDESLLAIADGRGFASDTAPWDLAQYIGAASGVDWRTTVQGGGAPTVAQAAQLRELFPVATFPGNIAMETVSRIDCAAAGGLVAVALQSGAAVCILHVMRADTGATVTAERVTGIRPRVVAVGTKFFFLALNAAATTLSQRSFDPAIDSAIQTLANLHSGAVVNCYDAQSDVAGTGYWVAYNLAGPTTSIVPVNSSGTAGTAIVGPAVTYQHVAVCQTSTRVHLVSVIAAGATQIRSYTTGGVLSSGPTTLDASTRDRQPGITDATTGGTEAARVVLEATDASLTSLMRRHFVNATTHAVNSVGTTGHVFLGSKPIPAGPIKALHFAAYLRPDGDFLSHGLISASSVGSFTTHAYKDRFAAVASNADTTPQIAKDSSTGKFYWPNLFLGADGKTWARVTELTYASNARRQTATVADLLYRAGGSMQIFDGKSFVEAAFFEKPPILSVTPSNGAGTLPSNTTLLIAVVYEYVDRRGNIWQSDVSNVETVTMGATDDTITILVAGPLGAKGEDTPIAVVAYRSVAGINQLRRATSVTTVSSTDVLTLTLTDPDSTVRTGGVIYTQAGRGILSGTLPHEAPLPCDYIWKFGARLLCASADKAFVSKEVFPGEPVNFSGDVGFSIPSIPDRIVGVAALDLRGFLFTAERIYVFVGDGPNDNGEGRYSEPVAVPGSTGLADWRSLVETPLGIMFQGSNGQIWVLPRDGSAPVWIGQPVRDTLVAFPIVTSATLCTEEQLVSFTCNNAGETDCRIVHYDLRAKTWIVDEFASVTPIKAATSYQGRLAYISGGVVYTEKTSVTPNTFIEHALTTGTINEFGSGWGKYVMVGLVGEYRGDCDIRARISYDDGVSFTNMATFQLRAANGLSVGETVELEWAPARRKAQSVRLDFQARTAGSATEGFVFNSWWTETQQERGGPRKMSSERG